MSVKVPLIEVEARVDEPVTFNELAVVEPVFEFVAVRFVIVALSAVRFWM